MIYTVLVIAIAVLWALGIVLVIRSKSDRSGIVLLGCGLAVLLGYMLYLWISYGRAPMKSTGETRLWYSLFLPVIGFGLYRVLANRWILVYGVGVSFVFLFINVVKPSNFDATLMPALQSPYFIPHVLVYIFAYALFAGAAIGAVLQLASRTVNARSMKELDAVVYIGTGLLTIGMILGAVWAKIAWGHYWSFDPKETWALISWMVYLLYIHLRRVTDDERLAAVYLIAGFLFVLVCWFGVNYLPAAATSIHIYSR